MFTGRERERERGRDSGEETMADKLINFMKIQDSEHINETDFRVRSRIKCTKVSFFLRIIGS